MREKKRCRWLALLLAVVMLLSVLPTAVFAAGESGNTFYRIFHLDCGRKYFTVDQVKTLIDTLAANHYTHIELAIGNDGLRFLLDDMSVTANDTTYTSDAVKDGIQAGNKAYYNAGTYNEWTQAEMDAIISYATSKSIEIIPLVNTPGHMDAILYACKLLCDSSAAYGSSSTTIDVTNSKAVAFTQALVQKYVTYFANKGCKFFNIGADEYAGTSFGALQSDGYYDEYADYVNDVAAIIKKANMTPMAFNDGIYYNGVNYAGNSEITFDTDIVICYWTYGYGGYYPASVAYLQSRGFKSFIHTNESWYYVLGRNDSSWAGYNTAENATKTIAVDSMSVDEIGAMLCVWCDTPSASYDNNATRVSTLISNLANNNPTYFVADSGETDPTDPGEVTNYETITVTVGQTATAMISGANYAGTYTTEDPTVATVEVTGEDATEATTTYTQASVYCRTLISDDSGDWIAASGYYYTPDGTNYYPVYAKRSSRSGIIFTEYTYTWGYSTTSSASNVTKIGKTQSTYSPYEKPSITVYTKSVTDGTPASTTVTFAGVAVGTTYVTVGNTRYTINVVAEDLSTVTPLTVEYWITNLRVTAGGATSKSISAQSAYGEAGVDISTLVPETGTYAYGSVVFWKGTVHDSNNKQTTDSGTEGDKTGSGKDFNLIRYYNGSWQYFYEADGTWNTISSTDQVVIYWLQPTEVTKEITTLTKDWGYDPSNQQGDNESKVALTIAVVYPDGTVSPAEGDMYSTSTTLFNYWSGRDIGLVAPVNNSDYAISKMTVTDGTRDQSGTGQWGANDTITWDKVTNEAGQQWYNETTYWDETVGGTPMVNGVTSNITWSNYNTAKLVLIYLKPIHYDTNLTVKWVDDSAGGALISTMEVAVSSDGTPITFYNGLIQTSALPEAGVGGTFTLDNDAYVTNSSNVNQTFNKNISTVPGVADKYKTGLYQYVSADLSADGKTLTLHYNVKADKTFVYDFGLPMQVNLGALVENADIVNSITFDRSEVVYANGVVTFTPTSAAVSTITTKAAITFNDNDTLSMTFAFVPASNVLYEENFMEPVEGSYVDWTHTEKSISAFTYDADTVYGYTSAYANCTGANGQYTASVAKNNSTDDLKFTFTGTGFDLIAQCGASTGTLMVRVDDENGNYVKSYLVDTSFNDSNVGNNLYQVPVIHEQNLENGTYTVTIFGAYIDYNPASNSNASPASTFSMRSVGSSAIDTIYELADRMGLSGDDLDGMEFINVDQLYGASAYAMTSAVRTASTGTADTQSDAPMTLGIDGFRVYRPDNQLYKETEQGVKYVNVLDAVNAATFAAYVEGKSNGTDYTVTNYEDRGGPQNEIYLAKDQAIAFRVTGSAQVSLRSVNGTEISADINGTTSQRLQHTTEMYYAVTAQDGLVTIKNTSDSLLAICNFKFAAGSSSASLTEEDYPVVYSMLRMTPASVPDPNPEQPGIEEPAPTPVFTPETFKTRVNSIRSRSKKIVTLTITASTDVDHVVVNGKTYYPMNKLLVKWGLSKTYVFTIMDTAGASETRSFEIVAYNADGLASSTYTDAG